MPIRISHKTVTFFLRIGKFSYMQIFRNRLTTETIKISYFFRDTSRKNAGVAKLSLAHPTTFHRSTVPLIGYSFTCLLTPLLGGGARPCVPSRSPCSLCLKFFISNLINKYYLDRFCKRPYVNNHEVYNWKIVLWHIYISERARCYCLTLN